MGLGSSKLQTDNQGAAFFGTVFGRAKCRLALRWLHYSWIGMMARSGAGTCGLMPQCKAHGLRNVQQLGP